MEKSLVLIKPDGVQKGYSGAILSRIEKEGLKLVALKMFQMSRPVAERHYAVHAKRDFFPGLINYITSGPIVAAVFEGRTPSTASGRLWARPTRQKRSREQYGVISARTSRRMPFTARIRPRPGNGNSMFFSSIEMVDYRGKSNRRNIRAQALTESGSNSVS